MCQQSPACDLSIFLSIACKYIHKLVCIKNLQHVIYQIQSLYIYLIYFVSVNLSILSKYIHKLE